MGEARGGWGYYVVPTRFGESVVGRVEFHCRKGVLELRRWHFEACEPGPGFMSELEQALRDFMKYCAATSIVVDRSVDAKIRALARSLKSG